MPIAESEIPARYLIGIDLGTTNSACAYVDSQASKWAVRDFPVPQLVAPGETEARDTLPSFHYEAAAGELGSGALRLPWDGPAGDDKRHCVGLFARERGAAVPGRLIASAKSWLSHSGVDRTAPLLPWHGAADVERLSPVEVSSRFLAHLRAAWDFRFPDYPLAAQDVVLTVPASFDEVARELTVQAARAAGLVKVVLVEEPQAAFYAWIYAHGGAAGPDATVSAGEKILIVDVGGGTSDFTLIRARLAAGGKVLFHRVAVGEHLILGGDNLDLALAHAVEQRLTGGGRLDPRQWGPLVRSCRAAKERLLGREPPERMTINLPGSGSKLIGGSLSAELTRDEAREVLVDGFLPRVALTDKPQTRRSGFQEFGLPYAPDAAITRYLAAFLMAHRGSAQEDPGEDGHDPARPDRVLFNGGLFESPQLRERLIEVLESWFNPKPDAPQQQAVEQAMGTPGDSDANTPHPSRSSAPEPKETPPPAMAARHWSPLILRNDRLDLAVARGAAYYGMVRRGRGVRISGGLAHSYYLGVDAGNGASAVCLVPAGVEEGQTVDLPGRRFDLLIRQPAEFPLYYSSTRTTDRPGALITIDPEQMTPLPPIRTVLQSGRKIGADAVSVHLHARLTEIGTLEIWCSEAEGNRQWRLQFDVRAAAHADAARHDAAGETQGLLDEQTLHTCRALIRQTFRKTSDGATNPPAGLVKRLEDAVGMSRSVWPASLMRGLWEALLEVENGRRIGLDHEARWLNLIGFCLRPGYGLAVDDWRIAQMWMLLSAGAAFPKNEQIRAEWWILWRRLAGGLSAGQQAAIADPLVADWRNFFRKTGGPVRGRSPLFQFGPHESAEVWRLLGSLERLKPAQKAELGDMILDRLPREKVATVRDAMLFCLGRTGARVPVYGPLNALVAVETVERWTHRLIDLNPPGELTPFALMQLTRRTNDRYRDVSEATRLASLDCMIARAAATHLVELVREGGHLREEEQRTIFGETLPRGLRIE